MATTSYYNIKIDLQGDLDWSQVFESTSNTLSEFQNGTVTITPSGTNIGTVSDKNIGFFILPPAGNTTQLEMRASTSATTGIFIHPTLPTLVSPGTSQVQIALFASTTISNIRVIRF